MTPSAVPCDSPVLRLAYVDVEIFDENDRPVPVGTFGEIVLRPKEFLALLFGY